MTKRPAKPAASLWITPCLTVRDIDIALSFYQAAFGFEKKFSMPGPDGRTVHAEVVWQSGSFMLGAEGSDHKCKSPSTTGARPPMALYVYCEDVDALFRRATAAGAKIENPPQDMFWGDRMCTLVDPDGYIWSFATNIGDFDPTKAPM
jgi:PhnB protein